MNTDNLTPNHVDAAIERALKTFSRYEQVVDFDHREASDGLFRHYQIESQLARDLAHIVGWRVADVERLP